MYAPAFCDQGVRMASSHVYERDILERFLRIHEERPDLIPEEVNVLEETGLSQSFQRGATLEARTRVVNPEDIDLAN